MGCGCGKNKPKVNQGPRNPAIVAQGLQQNTLRANVTPRPNIQAQQVSRSNAGQLPEPIPAPATPIPTSLSPAGLDSHKRRIEALRREAIRKSLNK